MDDNNNKNDVSKNAAMIIDKLVDAIGEPSASLTRVIILIDIHEHPDTSQSDISTRLDLDKAIIARNVDWLNNYGCITKGYNTQDGRENLLQVSAYSKNHLDAALQLIGKSHKYLKKFLHTIINSFTHHKATLRDAKILVTIGAEEITSKTDVTKNLYNGPASTDNRAIQTLYEEGLIEKNG